LLPDSEILRLTISKVIKAFEGGVQMELVRVRWEEIKRLQTTPTLKVTSV